MPVGPPRLPATRLNPWLRLTPNGSSVSYCTLPLKAAPPVRVSMLMMPDCALPNSAEEDAGGDRGLFEARWCRR